VNVLFLTPYVAWPLDHGGRIRTFHLLEAIAKEHHVVNLAVARAPKDREDALALAGHGVTVTPCLLPQPDMTLPAARAKKWLSIALGRSSLPGRWYGRDFADLVRSTVAGRKFDLAVVDTLWMDVYRRELGRIPFIAATQNVESDILIEIARREGGGRALVAERDARLLQRREAAFLAEAAAAVAVSEDDARRMRELAPNARVVVVENGADAGLTRPLPPPASDGPLLFVGSFDYAANVDAAVYLVNEVLPAVRERLPRARVLLAGRNPTADVLALAKTEGVEVAGSVKDLVPAYAAASAVVVPIRVGGGSRLKILEALALGRPVVTTTAGMRGLAVEDGVHVLVADTPAAFATALGKLGSDAGAARRLTDAGRAFVEERHDWPVLEKKFADLVERAGSARS
jgi:glycosyltransferase involved in cell wall biosynthesis